MEVSKLDKSTVNAGGKDPSTEGPSKRMGRPRKSGVKGGVGGKPVGSLWSKERGGRGALYSGSSGRKEPTIYGPGKLGIWGV